MSFAFQDGLLLAVALGNLALAGYVLLRNPRDTVHRSFFLFVLGFSVWIVSLVLLFSTQMIVYNQLIFYGGITALLGLFALSFTFPATQQLPKLFWIYSLPIIALYIGVPLNAFVSGITISAQNVVIPVLGGVFPLFMVTFAVYTLASFIIIARRYKRLVQTERQQMQFLFLGIFLFFATAIVVNILLPTLGIYQFNLLGAFASLAFTALTSYAIVRGRLFDLRLLLLRTMSFISVLVLFAVFLALVLFVGAATAFNLEITFGQYIFGLILMVVAMLIFQPLQKIIRRLTSTLFFQDIYDSDKFLSELTHAMAKTIDLDKITMQLLRLVRDRMHVSKGAFLLIDNHHITHVKSLGYDEELLQQSNLEELLHDQSLSTGHVLYDDLQDVRLKELFQHLDISVAIPIRVENNEVAILVLGPKLSGEIYFKRDLHVLDIFASEAGLAIQNAKSYAEVKRFSNRLEHMVDERTKQLEAAQTRELEKAQAVIKLRDEFVFIVAHELRTPVTAIRGFVELVRSSGQNFSKDVEEYLSHIKSASTHLNQLVNDLLEVARSDAGTTKIEVSAIDIVPILKNVVKEVFPLTQEKNITFRVHASENLLLVQADARKLKEIILNLLSNAIKYNRPSGTIDLSVSSGPGIVAIDVKDTGYGIPKAQQSKVFQKFFRAETKQTENVQGTGLGLFITRMLVEKMGGKITFTSKEGVGTTFSFSLPLVAQ